MSIKHLLSAGAFVIAAGGIATGAEASSPKAPIITTNVSVSNGLSGSAESARRSQQATSGEGANNSVTTYQPAASYPQTKYNKDNVAICPASIQAADRKELPKATPLAEQFWSRIACGRRDSAGAILMLAGKADPITPLTGSKKEAFALCMENSIPTTLSLTTRHGVTTEKFDLGAYDKKDQDALLGALANACKLQLGVK